MRETGWTDFDGKYAKWDKADTESQIPYDNHFYAESKKAELTETEDRVVFTRDWEAEEMGRFWSRGKNFQL